MDAKAKTVQEILYSPDQFLIPFFQRHYSWRVMHWQHLWDDLKRLATGAKIGKHFLGPLVCTPFKQMPGEIKVFLLIDGQQRLTTLTVLLAVLRDMAIEHELPDLGNQITKGYLIHEFQKGIAKYKVVPRTGDREVLFGLIDAVKGEFSRRDGIVWAYRFFRDGVTHFVKGDVEANLRRLFNAATGQMSLVVVNIDGENPYEIFESLNSRGLELEEADLIRNFIFMQVPLEEQDTFNQQHWQSFESMFEETDDYPALSPTLFYRDYLMRNGEYCRKGEAFIGFKKMLHGHKWDPPMLVMELKAFADYELVLRRPDTAVDEVLKKSLRRIEQLKITTAHPLIMHLMARRDGGKLTQEELLDCLTDLQSFIIRRSICGDSTRGYGEDLAAAIKAVKDSPRQDLQKYWLGRGWPDDKTFTARLVEFSLYRREPAKCRVILEALEQQFGHKESIDMAKLSIEHIMPQSIGDDKNGKAWQEMLGADWQRTFDTWLDTLGNLTLTGYNTNLSNKSFDRKREKLAESNLQLNKSLADLELWNAKAIAARGRSLAQKVAQLWNRPEGIYVKEAASFGSDEGEESVDAEDIPYKEYWAEFLTTLSKADDAPVPKTVGSKTNLIFPSPLSGSRFSTFVEAEDRCVSVELAFTGKYRESGIDVLEQDRAAIDAELKYETDWEHDGSPTKVIAFLENVRVTDRSDWPRQHEWLADMLRRFYAVIGPRLFTTEPEDMDFKKLALSFWTKFDRYLADNGSSIELTPPKAKTWRDEDLGHGVSFWMACLPEENWIGGGLQFSGTKGVALFEAAKLQGASLTSTIGSKVYVEESDEVQYTGSYRYVKLTDKTSWTPAHEWLKKTLEQSRKLYQSLLDSPAELTTNS